MKTKPLVLVLAVALASFYSCKKSCHECHYEDENDVKVELGEQCGDELNELEKDGIVVNGTTHEVHCHGH